MINPTARQSFRLVLAVAFALAPGAAAAGQKTTLTVWDWHAADTTKGPGLWLKNIDEAFQKAHPDIELRHVAQSHNEYYQIFKAAAASRSGPDVVMLHQGSRILGNKASLLPLTDFVSPGFKDKLVGWELTSEGYDASGTPYAVPIAVQGNVWYYNKPLLEEAGVDVSQPPQSWDAFLAACKAMREAGKAGIAVGEKEGHWAGWFINSSCFQTLSAADRERLRTGEMKWTDPKVAALFERLKELEATGCFQPGFMSTSLWPEARYIFLRGEAAFFLGLISDVAHWKDFAEKFGAENVGVMTCPVFRPGPNAGKFPVGGAFAYAVTRWSEVPEAAFEYIAFVSNQENAEAFLTQVGSFPANQKVDRSLFTDPNARQIAEWIAAGRTGTQFTGKLPEAVNDALEREGQRLLGGQTDVAGALEAIQGEMAAETAAVEPTPPGVLIAVGAGLVVVIGIIVLVLGRGRGGEPSP
jgi:ABC-type glycerol-3-phosphate transport system substrate-binding protein